MKVEVNSASFADAVAWTTSVLSQRTTNPILNGIKLTAEEGTLRLATFTYEMSARDRVEAGVDEAGTVVVAGKLLADISKVLPSEKAYLESEGSTLHITSGNSSFNLQLMPEAEYPDLPELPPLLGTLMAPVFIQAVAQATVAIARDDSRPVLAAVQMRFDGSQVTMSSTDRFRLARSIAPWTPENDQVETTALIKGSLLRDISRSIDEGKEVKLYCDPANPSLLGIENAGRISTVQLIDGEFPNVDRLYADEYPIHVVIDKHALVDAIKRVALVAERNAPIRMVFTGQEVTLSAGAQDEANAREVLEVDLDGDDITVAFNPNYLREGLSAITEPFVRMKMTTAIKPVEFNGQLEQDSDETMEYRYLLVPMRFNS